MRAFGRDQVLRADLPSRTTIHVGDRHRDAVRVLGEADDLAALDDFGADVLRAVAQDRLDSALADEQAPARAQCVVDSDVEPGDDVGELPPRQGVHADDRTLGEELLLGLRLHLVFDARGAKELDRPEVEVRRPGQRRSAAKSLDNERRHAVLCEEHRRGEPDEPSAGDDDWKLSSIFSRHTPKNRAMTPATSPGCS